MSMLLLYTRETDMVSTDRGGPWKISSQRTTARATRNYTIDWSSYNLFFL